ncbi:MAG: hypothetical protein WC755_08130 [Candidatus Woesearchaeota archaeon]|jgi:hypothetical protein
MKIRTATIILSLLFICELIYFTINKGSVPLIDAPFSTLGNIEGNYLVFLFGTGIILIGFILLVHKMYVLTRTKIGWEIYVFPAIVIITLIVPYNKEQVPSRVIHTALGIISSIILLWIIVKFNRNYYSENKSIKKFSESVPYLMFFGTLILFLLLGLNVFMELFFVFLLLLWLNLINFNLEKESEHRTGKTSQNR